MSASKLFSEIFEDFEKAETKEERIKVLRQNYHPLFRDFLILAFNPNIVFDVEVPNYRPAPEPAGLNYTYLDLEIPKLYRFIKDHPKRNPNLSEKKKTQLLGVILEALHKDEADLLVKVIKKQFKVKNLTVKLVQEAYGL